MTRPLAGLTVLTLALLAAPARGQETWTLRRQLRPGTRAHVQETSRSELTYAYRDDGAKVGAAEVIELARTYLEVVRAERPERLWRSFEVSTRSKQRPGAPAQPERTSLHGRAALVSGLALEPDGAFTISKDDREALRFDRLALALLPAQPVAKGARWQVAADELGRALFGEFVAPADVADSGAQVELRGVREADGRQVATLRVRALVLQLERKETLPGLRLELTGELRWALEEGVLLEAHLEGPCAYVVAGEGRRLLEARGTTRWAYQAELLSPEATADEEGLIQLPPGCRELVCRQDPTHRYPVADLACCLRCGRRLEERACPEHGWLLRRCPRDGAPLEAR